MGWEENSFPSTGSSGGREIRASVSSWVFSNLENSGGKAISFDIRTITWLPTTCGSKTPPTVLSPAPHAAINGHAHEYDNIWSEVIVGKNVLHVRSGNSLQASASSLVCTCIPTMLLGLSKQLWPVLSVLSALELPTCPARNSPQERADLY